MFLATFFGAALMALCERYRKSASSPDIPGDSGRTFG
jgi:hypothetical protein